MVIAIAIVNNRQEFRVTVKVRVSADVQQQQEVARSPQHAEGWTERGYELQAVSRARSR